MTNDEANRQTIMKATVARAPAEGFTLSTLANAARDAGLADERQRLFPNGVGSLLTAWSGDIDGETARCIASLPATGASNRIRAGVLARLKLMTPHKDAARRAAAVLALPHHAPLAAKLVWNSADAIWRSAGDHATDFNWYTKRAILAGILAVTTARWLVREEGIELFLDAELANVACAAKTRLCLHEDVSAVLAALSDRLGGRPNKKM